MYQKELKIKGHGAITTEIRDAPPFYYAEDYHQQYLAKNPFGYCGLGGTGVSCPIGLGAATAERRDEAEIYLTVAWVDLSPESEALGCAILSDGFGSVRQARYDDAQSY